MCVLFVFQRVSLEISNETIKHVDILFHSAWILLSLLLLLCLIRSFHRLRNDFFKQFLTLFTPLIEHSRKNMYVYNETRCYAVVLFHCHCICLVLFLVHRTRNDDNGSNISKFPESQLFTSTIAHIYIVIMDGSHLLSRCYYFDRRQKKQKKNTKLPPFLSVSLFPPSEFLYRLNWHISNVSLELYPFRQSLCVCDDLLNRITYFQRFVHHEWDKQVCW